MKEEYKKCWSCGRYKAFYTKGFAYFNKEKIGLCRQHNKITESHERCDKWSYQQIYRKMRKGIALKQLTELLDRFTVIEQILKEENELDKIKFEQDES